MTTYQGNISSFSNAASAIGTPDLASCYCVLVAMELCLKANSTVTTGHDLDPLIADYLSNVPIATIGVLGVSKTALADATAASRMAQLQTAIKSIWVTKPNGTLGSARSTSYPDIRYARFTSDPWIPPASTIGLAQLTALDTAVSNLHQFLKFDLGMPL